MKTCKTLAELRDAYASGTIIAPLIIGHPDCEVSVPAGPVPDYENEVVIPGGYYDDYETVFEMDMCDLLKQALDLLGIPHEHD